MMSEKLNITHIVNLSLLLAVYAEPVAALHVGIWQDLDKQSLRNQAGLS
jgi:hypothetical protein